MSSIGSSGESLSALLSLISDPATHKARLDELLSAQGKLDKASAGVAVTQAKTDAARQQLTADVSEHKKVVGDFAAEREAILAKAKEFDDREAAVSQREDAAQTREVELTAAQESFETISGAKGKELTDREKKLADGEVMLSAAQADLQAGQKALEVRMARLNELTQ